MGGGAAAVLADTPNVQQGRPLVDGTRILYAARAAGGGADTRAVTSHTVVAAESRWGVARRLVTRVLVDTQPRFCVRGQSRQRQGVPQQGASRPVEEKVLESNVNT